GALGANRRPFELDPRPGRTVALAARDEPDRRGRGVSVHAAARTNLARSERATRGARSFADRAAAARCTAEAGPKPRRALGSAARGRGEIRRRHGAFAIGARRL